jgi:hypothetical protein
MRTGLNLHTPVRKPVPINFKPVETVFFNVWVQVLPPF